MKTKRHVYKKRNKKTRKQRISKNVVGYLEKSKHTKRRKLTGAGHCSSKYCINENKPQLLRPLPPQSVSSPFPQIQTFSLPPKVETPLPPKVETPLPPKVETPLPPKVETHLPPKVETHLPPKVETSSSPQLETPLHPQQLETSSSPQLEIETPLPPLNPKDTLNTLIQDRENNMGKMLNVACKNPDNCLALGAYGSYIKRYFDNFRNLSLINNRKIKRIGKPSANGFIIELPFTKNGFTAYTALKCSAKSTSDNLFYEYYVGKFFITPFLI